MARTHGMQAYIEAIYVLESEGNTVVSSQLADYLGVSRPTVSQTMQRLQASGYVVSHEGRELLLTREGRDLAEQMVRRHRVLERWLTDELGMDWADAHVEAGRLEHAVSKVVEDKLFEKLGRPTTCPHGNVIPGTEHRQPSGMPLHQVQAPLRVQVIRIVEQAEEDLELLRFLYRAGIVPNAWIDVEAVDEPFEVGVPILVGEHAYRLDPEVAARVLVRPLADEAL